MASRHNRFLNDSSLTTSLNNISPEGQRNILGITDDHYLEESTGKIKDSFIPDLSITSVTVVADIAARDALTVQTGDVAIVNSDADGDKSTFIYDGSAWQQIFNNYLLNSLTDVTVTSPLQNHVLFYDAGVWKNILGPTNSQWQNIINLLDQQLTITSDVTFDNVHLNDGKLSIVTNGAETYNFDGLSSSSGDVYINYTSGTGSFSVFKGDSGASYASHTLQFRVDADGRVYILSDLNTVSEGSIAYYQTDSKFYLHDGTGQMDLRALLVHANRSNLDSINQDLNSTDHVTFESVTFDTEAKWTNQTSGVFLAGSIHYLNNQFEATDGSGSYNLRDVVHVNRSNLDSINQDLATTDSPSFSKITLSDGILTMDGITSQVIDTNTGNLGFRDKGAASIGMQIDATLLGPSISFYNDVDGNFMNISSADKTNQHYKFQMGNDTGDTNSIILGLNDSTLYADNIQPTTGELNIQNSGGNTVAYADNTYDSLRVSKIQSSESLFKTIRIYNDTGSTRLDFATNEGYMAVLGSVRCGSTTYETSYKLRVDGTQASTTSSTFTVVSDQRMKKNIVTCDNSNILTAFENLRIVDFQYKYDDEIRRGVIAQELKNCECFSDCVKGPFKESYTDTNTKEEVIIEDCYHLNTDKMIFSSFEAIKLLIEQNKTMELRIKTLEAELGL